MTPHTTKSRHFRRGLSEAVACAFCLDGLPGNFGAEGQRGAADFVRIGVDRHKSSSKRADTPESVGVK